jgi:CRISPR-associated endonuclease/helicase Cas3
MKPAHGIGLTDRFAMPYPDIIGVEATRRLVELHRVWSIPAMNRELVECATHPEAIAELTDALLLRDPTWAHADQRKQGRAFAFINEAAQAVLCTDFGFDDPRVVIAPDERAMTRLGATDLMVELPEQQLGPFGRVRGFLLASYWFRNIDMEGELTPVVTACGDGWLSFDIQGRRFQYDALGVRPLIS